MAQPAHGSVLAFDFGAKRIGVACGELSLRMAHALTTLRAESNDARLAAVTRLVDEWRPVQLVVGVPKDDTQVHPLAKQARKFAAQLERKFALPVALVDETLSSVDAGWSLRDAGVRADKQKALLDQVAAQHILSTYFALLDAPAAARAQLLGAEQAA